MLILALNCGSSSIKSALIDVDRQQRLLDVRVENIGVLNCRLLVNDVVRPLDTNTDATAALTYVLDALRPQFSTLGNAAAVVHRVVHGGELFVHPTLIDESTLTALGTLDQLAPLHNPPALAAIRQCRAALPNLPHIAVFDTAFHTTLPRRARAYALPIELTQRLGIRRFGFHGINHAHVMAASAAYLKAKPQALRIISCHLGNGASVAAIEYGCSVETSMGMTPLEGLVMGTRGGDIDPGILLQLLHTKEFDVARLDTLLNNESGLRGLAGTNDLHDIELRAAAGDEPCRLAIALYAHRARKYIGAYAAVMGGVDVIAFTGGVGEHSALLRHRIAQRLDFFGAVLDEDLNRDLASAVHVAAEISAPNSRVRILVIKADEELAMARDAAALLSTRTSNDEPPKIPVAISARHAHLSQPTLDRLFGPGYQLKVRAPLSQTGQFSAQEIVTLIGPRGRIENVRLMGPPRAEDQIELSRSDEFSLGIDAPVRLSGDLSNTPGITIEGPVGKTTIRSGVICARRHIHMSPQDATRLALKDHDSVAISIDSEGRDLIFKDVIVRVSPQFTLELHLDTDEANAAGVKQGDTALLLRVPARDLQ